MSSPYTGGYREKHHIIPKCIGGTNDKSNIVTLSAREHFICHMLLIRMTTGVAKTKMIRALSAFRASRSYQHRNLTARQYEIIRVSTSNNAAWNKGIPRSAETKSKISKALLGQPSKMKGQHFSEAAAQAIAIASREPDRCLKISKALKGRISPTKGMTRDYTPFDKLQCPHCSKCVGKNNFPQHLRKCITPGDA
jgi:hypothetical protein